MNMEDYMAPVLAQLREALEPTFAGLGLALDCQAARQEFYEGFYEVSFRASERVFHPLSLFFPIAAGNFATAKLHDAEVVEYLYRLEELSANGWFKFFPFQKARIDLKDSDAEALEQIRESIEYLEIINDDYEQPFVVRSDYLVIAHPTITCFEKNVIIERDLESEVERFVFQTAGGQTVLVNFPYSETAYKSWVEVDGENIGTFDSFDTRELEALLVRACGNSLSPRR